MYNMVGQIKVKLSKRVKELRKKYGYTQEKLAELSGVSYENIQKIEGKSPHNPQLDTLEKLAKGFKITLSELFNM